MRILQFSMQKLFIIISAAVLVLALVLTSVLVSCNRKVVEVAELLVESASSIVEETTPSEEVTSLEESSEVESLETVGSKVATSSSKAMVSSKAPASSSVAPSAAPSSVAPPSSDYPKNASEFLSAVMKRVNTSGYAASCRESDTVNGRSGVTAVFKSNGTGHEVAIFCPQTRLDTETWWKGCPLAVDGVGSGVGNVSEESFGRFLNDYR